VGIDIELIDDKINRISQKFLSPDDRKVLNPFFISTENAGKYLTLAWSCKEAIFKWYCGSGVDFRKHINLKSIVPVNENQLECIYLFSKNEELYLDLHSVFFDDLCMSWVLT
jgi:phosphopantetheinyl transferase